jgi:hypothetical protein
MTVSNNRISNAISESTVLPKQVPIKPLTKLNSRSPYAEPTVMKRLPISLLPAVNRMLSNRIAVVQELAQSSALPSIESNT